jgi:two-component system alkaline phosphatase synthesis response regulator PhoP
VLRRTSQNARTEVYEANGLQVYPNRHMVLVNGEEVALTPKEFELLCLFMSNPGLALSRGQLQDHVWGMEYLGETRTVDVHIRTLRQKLGACGEYIETVRGVGYRFQSSAMKN